MNIFHVRVTTPFIRLGIECKSVSNFIVERDATSTFDVAIEFNTGRCKVEVALLGRREDAQVTNGRPLCNAVQQFQYQEGYTHGFTKSDYAMGDMEYFGAMDATAEQDRRALSGRDA